MDAATSKGIKEEVRSSDSAATAAERFREHLRAASGALGQSRTGLMRRAVRAVELSGNLQVRSCKPNCFSRS